MKSKLIACALILLGAESASAGTATELKLDLQPVNGVLEAGFEGFEATNQVLPVATQSYSAFGGTVDVDLTTANLPDGNDDFRAVPRNGVASTAEKENDWIGVDTRGATAPGVDVTMTLTFSNIPAGDYSWLSTHHDGGSDATNGNLNGTADYSITDANGTVSVLDGITISEQDEMDPISTLGFNFTSDGSDVVFSMIMDNAQGGTDNALFALMNSVEITLVPEPSTVLLLGLGAAALLCRRQL